MTKIEMVENEDNLFTASFIEKEHRFQVVISVVLHNCFHITLPIFKIWITARFATVSMSIVTI